MKPLRLIRPYARDLFRLFFPDLCICCAETPSVGKSPFCFSCAADLPFTNFHLRPDNPFTRHFDGRIALEFGAALFYFRPGGRVMNMMHWLKYENRPDIGEELGKWQAADLQAVEVLRDLSMVTPVPLHPARERKRGYNQSARFARGLSRVLGIGYEPRLLRRKKNTISQTGLDRAGRFDNMEGAFALSRNKRIEQKHILVVDDVLTTGATLEACARELIRKEGVRISMLTIAIGS